MIQGACTEQSKSIFEQAESQAYPAVFRGINKSWPALSRWAGLPGLQYLQDTAGEARVQAMYSDSSHFFGDLQHHQPVDCTLKQLLTLAAQQQQQQQMQASLQQQQQQQQPYLYLAQQSLDRPALSALLSDVPVPHLLANKQLTSCNMWFSSSSSRSSLHYDPYQNLLCVVTGCKTVRMYPPAAVLGFYPRPLGGEASNHSSVNFAQPDYSQHPLYRHAESQCIKVSLHPGDALFMPEGWWHEVDSANMTLAVNFWWSSDLTSQLRSQPHQHHYYLRMLLASTSTEAVQQLISSIQPWQSGASCDVQRDLERGDTLGRPDSQAGTAAVRPGDQAGIAHVRPDDQAAGAAVRLGDQARVAAAGADDQGPGAAVRPDNQAGVATAWPGRQAAAGRICKVDGGACVSSSDIQAENHSAGPDSPNVRPSGQAGPDSQQPSPGQDAMDVAVARKRPRTEQAEATPAATPAAAAAAATGTVQDQALVGLTDEQHTITLEAFESAALRDLVNAAAQLQDPARTWKLPQRKHRLHEQQATAAAAAAAAAGEQQQQQLQTTSMCIDAGNAAATTAALLADAHWWASQAQSQQELLYNCLQGRNDKSLGSRSSSDSGRDTKNRTHKQKASKRRKLTQAQLAYQALGTSSSSGGSSSSSGGSSSSGSSSSSSGGGSSSSSSDGSSDSDNEGSTPASLKANTQQQKYIPGSSSRDYLGLHSTFTRLLAALQPLQLLRVLWAAAVTHRGAVASLLLHGLAPAAAQLLTEKLEAADVLFADDDQTVGIQQQQQQQHEHQQQQCVEASGHPPPHASVPFSRSEFYSQLYGTVPDATVVLEFMLRRKTQLMDAAAAVIIKAHTGLIISG